MAENGGAGQAARQELPAQSELVIGLVGPLGVNLDDVARQTRKVLGEFDYQCHSIRLTDQLREFNWSQELVEEPLDERIASYMTAGNCLRESWSRDDAFAFLAVVAITLKRRSSQGRASGRQAFIVRSLKRKEEAEFLRKVYRDRFILLSLYSPKESRVKSLDEMIGDSRVPPHAAKPVHSAVTLVDRDEAELDDHGQNVRGIFHEGDFFIDLQKDTEKELRRSFEVLFGHPYKTPTKDEAGMFYALAASLRSAELGRQVGAAICAKDGTVLAVGTNEVPKAGGGAYWEGDPGDAREFTLKFDSNDIRKVGIAEKLADQLVNDGLVGGEVKEEIVALVKRSEVDNLIEFVRAVHAEMAAISDASRSGVSLSGATLYVTTFPCHMCARHIVSCGISRVVYIAPYAKSLAGELHRDSICVDPPQKEKPEDRVVFEPFAGVGPRRYMELFKMPERKDRSTGGVVSFDPKKAEARISDIEPSDMMPEVPAYMRREQRVFELLEKVMIDTGTGFRLVESA